MAFFCAPCFGILVMRCSDAINTVASQYRLYYLPPGENAVYEYNKSLILHGKHNHTGKEAK
jgi:hypothetical protein